MAPSAISATFGLRGGAQVPRDNVPLDHRGVQPSLAAGVPHVLRRLVVVVNRDETRARACIAGVSHRTRRFQEKENPCCITAVGWVELRNENSAPLL